MKRVSFSSEVRFGLARGMEGALTSGLVGPLGKVGKI